MCLQEASHEQMRVFHVQRLSGGELLMEVDRGSSVQQFVVQIAMRLALPPTSLRVVQDARVLAKGDLVGDLKGDRVTAISVPSSEYGLGAGDLCETLHPVTVRDGESFDSQIIAEVGERTTLEVLDVGEGRRLLVTCGSAQGWISYKTRRNEPLVVRKEDCQSASTCSTALEVGLQYVVCQSAKLRAGSQPYSPESARLAPGTHVLVLEVESVRPEIPRSARVVVSRGEEAGHLGMEGWLHLAEAKGSQPLLQATGADVLADPTMPSPAWSLATLLRSMLTLDAHAA